jgi:hypothetical protein
MKRGQYVLDLGMERRGFVCGTGDELDSFGWHDGSWVLLDESGTTPDEGSWWAPLADLSELEGEL